MGLNSITDADDNKDNTVSSGDISNKTASQTHEIKEASSDECFAASKPGAFLRFLVSADAPSDLFASIVRAHTLQSNYAVHWSGWNNDFIRYCRIMAQGNSGALLRVCGPWFPNPSYEPERVTLQLLGGNQKASRTLLSAKEVMSLATRKKDTLPYGEWSIPNANVGNFMKMVESELRSLDILSPNCELKRLLDADVSMMRGYIKRDDTKVAEIRLIRMWFKEPYGMEIAGPSRWIEIRSIGQGNTESIQDIKESIALKCDGWLCNLRGTRFEEFERGVQILANRDTPRKNLLEWWKEFSQVRG